ncbi:MAG: ATP-binding cassette domain-containing protein [Candidatus Latescibacteria bacterium]|nr:ATP-binding cassette domain-containing protein [Candidatus Latescibacterota bacterium]
MLLQLRAIEKRFPGVHALAGVDFDLAAGEVHALVGENGAGKSTLIKILAGVHLPTAGDYLLDQVPAAIATPHDAVAAGISVVHQELNLVPSLSVAENIFFGRLPSRKGRVLWGRLYRETDEILRQLGLKLDPRTKVQHLSIAAQQLVEIGRALSCRARVLILDEPTSALSPTEIEALFTLLRRLRDQGVGIIYISHKLDEVLGLADRATVLRDGQWVGTAPTGELDEGRLIRLMVGRQLDQVFPRSRGAAGSVLLQVEGLATDLVQAISFAVRRGEIVGFSGLMGAGRTELARAVFGVDRRRGGRVLLEGQPVPANAPPQSRRLGLGLVSEDRRAEGLFAQLSVAENMSISSLPQFCRGWHIRGQQVRRKVEELVSQLAVRTPSVGQIIAKLSGGNQQKVLIARWLMKDNLKVLIVDEPTRGVDVGAKVEIYSLLDQLAGRGLGVVVISSELPELLGLCDRIYVMKGGRITGEFKRGEATKEGLLARAI